MEVEACIHLKCAESVVQREIVPMIIIVFSNKGGTDKILSVIVDNACANQKVEIEFTVPLFSFVGLKNNEGSLVGNGGGERDTSQAITRKYPVVGITETDIGIGVFYIVDFHAGIHCFQYEIGKFCIIKLKIVF